MEVGRIGKHRGHVGCDPQVRGFDGGRIGGARSPAERGSRPPPGPGRGHAKGARSPAIRLIVISTSVMRATNQPCSPIRIARNSFRTLRPETRHFPTSGPRPRSGAAAARGASSPGVDGRQRRGHLRGGCFGATRRANLARIHGPARACDPRGRGTATIVGEKRRRRRGESPCGRAGRRWFVGATCER